MKKILNPLCWPLAKTLCIIAFIVGSTWVLYVPYTPRYDAHYGAESFASASLRASYWLGSCLLASYVLHTRRLVRTTTSGEIAYILMILFHIFMLIVLAVIYFSGPRGEIGIDPFWG